ncbi:hypothetical protein [uncultured Thiocystis sp.]|jgi:hypothetical protein|uniref:hypothetical protein n=1 Tax=uncultured Thiocystis sp. TaxID=1202134 RepID=UPI0025EE631C|nr:hypothetical protein [uncultured Thiocystis sp.]
MFFSQCADAYREVPRLVERKQLDSVVAEAEIPQVAERVARQLRATASDLDEAANVDASDTLKALSERWSLEPDALLELPRESSLQAFEGFEILLPGSTLVY